jgi:hypothetical protein
MKTYTKNLNYRTPLQAFRKLSGLTVEQLAEATGVNVSQVVTLDNGERIKRILADYFDTTMDELWPNG